MSLRSCSRIFLVAAILTLAEGALDFIGFRGGWNFLTAQALAQAGPPAAITPSLISSRTNGVAPLAVFFDASLTTAPAVTSRPFHDLEYTWDFGDAAGGARWSTTGSGKNSAYGPMAAHVFEKAGTYTVTLTIADGISKATARTTITVTSPDTVFSGANTVCLSVAAAFDGCPDGAVRAADASGGFDQAISRYLTTDRRLLFRRGETWHTSTAAVLNKNGPWAIGAYGSGAKPIVRRSAGGAMIQVGSSGSNLSDARIMDLELNGNASPATCFHATGTFNNLLLLRTDCHHSGTGYQFDALNAGSLASVWNGVTFAEVTATDIVRGNGFFVTGRRMAVLGSTVRDVGPHPGEHAFRSMYLDKAVISENIFSTPAPTKHSLTIRAPEWAHGSTGTRGVIPANSYTQQVIVSGNRIVGGSGVTAPVSIAMDGGHDARVRHLIIERNWWSGGVSSSWALVLNASYSTLRNNIIDFSDSAASGQNCIVVNSANSLTTPSSNWIYNNTCYSRAAPNNFRMVWIRANGPALPVDTTVRNNLGYAPNARSNVAGLVNEGAGTVASNNSTDSQVKGTSPRFSGPLSSPSGFALSPGSYAIDAGTPAAGVFTDFLGSSRRRSPDLGAFEFGGSSEPAPTDMRDNSPPQR